MRHLIALSAIACLLASPATSAPPTLCGGRVKVLSVSPQWNDNTPSVQVSVANRTNEAILLQPVLTTQGRPQAGQPFMLVRNAEGSFALRLPSDQPSGLAPEALLRGLGAACRMG